MPILHLAKKLIAYSDDGNDDVTRKEKLENAWKSLIQSQIRGSKRKLIKLVKGSRREFEESNESISC